MELNGREAKNSTEQVESVSGVYLATKKCRDKIGAPSVELAFSGRKERHEPCSLIALEIQ